MRRRALDQAESLVPHSCAAPSTTPAMRTHTALVDAVRALVAAVTFAVVSGLAVAVLGLVLAPY